MATLSRQLHGGLVGRARAVPVGLIGLDFIEPVHDAAADLDEGGALTGPTPALQRARADLPSSRQLDLVEMCD
jgi:hypothetical protein